MKDRAHPEGSERLDPWDVVCFPRGPKGAHRVSNETEEPVRVLMFSNVLLPTATVYPDSDKIGVWPGHDPDNVMMRRADAHLGYYDGESS